MKNKKKILNEAKKKLNSLNLKNFAQESIDDLKLSLSLFEDIFKKKYTGLDKKVYLYLIGVIVYFINPFDAIPDFILSIGLLDDFTVVSMFLKKYKKEIDEYRIWKEGK